MSDWHPREDDLRPHAQRALDEAYQTRERARCSRDDFADSFFAALVFLGSRSSFKDGRFPAARPSQLD